MDYRSKLCEFIDDLNRIGNDSIMFPFKTRGCFELSLEDGLRNISEGISKDFCRVTLRYKEGNEYHLIYTRLGVESNDIFSLAYFDILRSGILGIDSVGQMKDSFGHDMNFLNFATLLTEGLQKLKTK